ncbi:MAG: M20 family metallo-hydrolase, partial [Planctomycetes bacterium]|nr:M20 family metallo-hydrolase [Planctomycetota bacterium]
NQQGVASAVFAARAFIEEGIQPERTLAILLCADEETGSALGLEAVLKQHPDYFSPEHLIIAPDIGAPDSTMIEVAEKSILWLKFTTSGKQCHASKPDNGINAMEAASELIVRLKELRERYPAQEPIFIPPESTFVPTKREANVPNVNTMPGEDIFCMDCRLLPEVDVDEVLAVIHEICGQVEKATGVTIACDIEMRADSAPSTPPDAPIVHALKASVREVYGREAKPMGVGGGTVAAIFRRAGLPAAVWATINQTAHQPDESCAIANMVGDAKVFAHVCMQRG